MVSNDIGFNLGKRLVIIIFFLLFLWYFLNYLVLKIKSGQLKIPEFFLSKIPTLKALTEQKQLDLYKMEIIQTKLLPDGSELMVLDVDGRHLLLSRHVQSGVNYVTDLNSKPL